MMSVVNPNFEGSVFTVPLSVGCGVRSAGSVGEGVGVGLGVGSDDAVGDSEGVIDALFPGVVIAIDELGLPGLPG